MFFGCTVEFIPEVDEKKEVLVVEGMVTDQLRSNKIIISKSQPLGKILAKNRVAGAQVTITDENGIVTTLKEYAKGVYQTDSTKFRGHVGGKYSLKIKINNVNYGTDLIEMQPVPQISSVYYEKDMVIPPNNSFPVGKEGCKIFLDTYDPENKCSYYRWDFVETYEYRLPYNVPNRICWITKKSDLILIKNTSIYNQARVTKQKVADLSEETEKLIDIYSILVNQYSLSENEYNYWEKLRNITQNVGSLYDITPVSIPSNIVNLNNPGDKVLGYFSVSAVSQKRIFIDDYFKGYPNLFTNCVGDTIQGRQEKEGLNKTYWIIDDQRSIMPPFYIITYNKECADCTTKGTNKKPEFWPYSD